MRKFGPGLIVTAAFIGPGTLTTASYAGASYGFALLWAILFSIVTTFVLQDMSIRLGLATRLNLAEAFRQSFTNIWLKRLAIFLIIAAIGIGNAAYEAGNITGAAFAIANATNINQNILVVAIGLAAGLLLWIGQYKILEKVLIFLVLLMSVVFIATFLIVDIDWSSLAIGLFNPSIPDGALLTTIALVGTTIVPYNLFLHASAVQEKWPDNLDKNKAIREARLDAGFAITLGGLITIVIAANAAGAFFQQGQEFSMATMSEQLSPVLGSAAPFVFSLGLFAAGMTSAIAAPIAASYAVCGALNKPTDLNAPLFKIVWMTVLICGVFFASTGIKPLTIILFAQAANGLLLPIIAVFLLVIMNNKSLLKNYANSNKANVVASILVGVVCLLGLYKLYSLVS